MRPLSTYHYFECPEHDPPLRSPDEFTQHFDDEPYRDGIRLAMQRPLSEDWSGDDSYFQSRARRFLYQHPRCHLNIIDEYGERRPLEIEGRSQVENDAQLLTAEISDLQAQLQQRIASLERLRTVAQRQP